MRNDNKAEKQHYVPQFLLNNFCTTETQSKKNKQIHVFDKHTDRRFITNIKDIVSERDFNEIEFEGKTLSLEPHLTKLETECAPIIKKIIDNENLNCLTDEDKEWIAVFVSSQFHRVRRTRETIEELIDGIKQHMSNMGIDEKTINETCDYDTNFIKGLSLGSLLDQRYPSLILSKVWVLLKTPDEFPFYISDNPISMHNDNNYPPYGNLGFGMPTIQIYLPLSRNFTLAFWCPAVVNEFYKNRENLLETKELLSRKKQLQTEGNNIMLSSLIEMNNTELVKLTTFLSLIEQGSPIIQKPENTKFLNSHQVRWSYRFVMCSHNNFSLVEEMINKNPQYRESIKIRFN